MNIEEPLIYLLEEALQLLENCLFVDLGFPSCNFSLLVPSMMFIPLLLVSIPFFFFFFFFYFIFGTERDRA